MDKIARKRLHDMTPLEQREMLSAASHAIRNVTRERLTKPPQHVLFLYDGTGCIELVSTCGRVELIAILRSIVDRLDGPNPWTGGWVDHEDTGLPATEP